jgi:hypothetical protein
MAVVEPEPVVAEPEPVAAERSVEEDEAEIAAMIAATEANEVAAVVDEAPSSPAPARAPEAPAGEPIQLGIPGLGEDAPVAAATDAETPALPEPVAPPAPIVQPQPVVTPQPVAQPEPVVQPAPPVVPLAPAASASQEPASLPAAATLAERSGWTMVAPETPPVTQDQGAAAGGNGHVAPSWPEPTAAPEWPAQQRPAPVAAGRSVHHGTDTLWVASTRDVVSRPGSGVSACVSCGLPLSANARFCRRCGSRQGT